MDTSEFVVISPPSQFPPKHLAVSQKLCIFAPRNVNEISFLIMAKPIKETPVLVGSEAIRLAKKIDNPRVVTSQEVIQARDAYNAVMSIAKFQF